LSAEKALHRAFGESPRCHITGCAVARHCYDGDVSFLWATHVYTISNSSQYRRRRTKKKRRR